MRTTFRFPFLLQFLLRSPSPPSSFFQYLQALISETLDITYEKGFCVYVRRSTSPPGTVRWVIAHISAIPPFLFRSSQHNPTGHALIQFPSPRRRLIHGFPSLPSSSEGEIRKLPPPPYTPYSFSRLSHFLPLNNNSRVKTSFSYLSCVNLLPSNLVLRANFRITSLNCTHFHPPPHFSACRKKGKNLLHFYEPR